MKRFSLCFVFFFCLASLIAQTKEIRLKIIQTSDVHGNYFPYDFIENTPSKGSLSRVATYLKQERAKSGTHVLYLDNGDILQGQPSAYYANFVDTVSPHLCARMLNSLKPVAGTIGNHDIEAGKKVYDRFVKQSTFPWLAANAVLDQGRGTYFKPYIIYTIEGVRVAVLGMITPAIPTWLPKTLWPTMHFEEVQACTRQWIPILKSKEKADIIICLYHLGMDSHIVSNGMDENGGEIIARTIPGMDVLMIGHDHRAAYKKVPNVSGDSVVIINPGANAYFVSDVEIRLSVQNGKVVKKQASGQLVSMENYQPDSVFIRQFQNDFKAVKSFVSKKIGIVTQDLMAREAYFGPSSFMDLIHRVQLDLTGADVSFAAPLSFDPKIAKGDLYVSDMFKLYKYENFLYTMSLSGKEIKDFLESSYGIWMNQMKSPDDHLLLITKNDNNNRFRFINPSYNFDSAAGISYTIDVSKPAGQRISIDPKMANGKTFDLNKQYKVAVNSYRGNGGGEHLTKGAGIPLEKLPARIITSTEIDLRYYMMEWIKKKKVIEPVILSQWKIIPEDWAKPAAEKDYELLFGKK